jgi:acyl-coenzyme A thioesterase PaaI-like protein
MSTAALDQALSAVPFLATLGVRVEETGPGWVVLRLPHGAAVSSHTGAIHNAAVFALAETAAAVAVATHPVLGKRRHRQKSARVKYYLAVDRDVTAHASVTPEMLSRVEDSAVEATIEVAVAVYDGYGKDVAEVVVNFAVGA